MTPMDPELIARLSTGEGAGLLASLPPYDERAAMALATRLRGEGFAADLVAAALTQSRLRTRARAKFADAADTMFFTPDGLEQATRPQLAQAHAARFADAGMTGLLDLGCGIGSDAIAASRAGLAVQALDVDPTTAAVAAANLRPFRASGATVGRAEDVALPGGTAARRTGLWFDPARRTAGVADATGRTRRTFSLTALTPSWDFVHSVCSSAHAAGAKLSPAMAHAQVPAGCEAQWTSFGGEVLECTVWWGGTVRTVGRTARVVAASGDAPAAVVTEQDAGGAEPDTARLDRLEGYLYEADRAVVRAGLVGALVRATDGRELAGGVGYVSSPRSVDLPWARRFVVREAMPLNVKALRRWCRDHDIGRVTIKKKGVTVDADQLRRQLRLSGAREQVLLVARVSGTQAVLMVQPDPAG